MSMLVLGLLQSSALNGCVQSDTPDPLRASAQIQLFEFFSQITGCGQKKALILPGKCHSTRRINFLSNVTPPSSFHHPAFNRLGRTPPRCRRLRKAHSPHLGTSLFRLPRRRRRPRPQIHLRLLIPVGVKPLGDHSKATPVRQIPPANPGLLFPPSLSWLDGVAALRSLLY